MLGGWTKGNVRNKADDGYQVAENVISTENLKTIAKFSWFFFEFKIFNKVN